MKQDTMYALSPLDGRYIQIEEELAPYFSEFALMKNRVKIEVKWLIFLIINLEYGILKQFNSSENINKINDIFENFCELDYKKIKNLENITNHDVKAVELFIAEKLKEIKLEKLISFIHIGCTSEDINNTAYATMIVEALHNVWIPAGENLINNIYLIAKEHANTPMLAHTHGQPATPTTLGKEMMVYINRLKECLNIIKSSKIKAKFNGATGTYAAIYTAFPNEHWPMLCKRFVEEHLNLKFNNITTQIESYDSICYLFDYIRHFNNILLDFDVDMWLYISMEYFKQIAIKTEVGSSTMPHKVNPIRFENSESNVDMSNAILLALSNKLSKSRMQRDLSDSSSKRNIGLAFGYSLQAIQQTIGGLKKVEVNKEKIKKDLNDRWEVLAEPIQTILRKYGISDAYDRLKELTRGKDISKEIIQQFIKSLEVLTEEDRKRLLELTPSTYIGLANRIVEDEL